MATTLKIWLNQQYRTAQVVESRDGCDLAVYTMPAGRAFLVRVLAKRDEVTKHRLTQPASKAERKRHALPLAMAEAYATHELEDKAEDSRGSHVRLRRMRIVMERRTNACGQLVFLILSGCEIPADAVKEVRGLLKEGMAVYARNLTSSDHWRKAEAEEKDRQYKEALAKLDQTQPQTVA